MKIDSVRITGIDFCLCELRPLKNHMRSSVFCTAQKKRIKSLFQYTVDNPSWIKECIYIEYQSISA